MPYLRMFLGEQLVDETYISEVFLQSVLGNHFIEEEKQKMLEKHTPAVRKSAGDPLFTLDNIPSSINYFTPLSMKKNESE